MTPTKDEITQVATDQGIDLVGYVRWADLESVTPEYDKPSSHSTHLTTLIVLAKRCLTGVACAKDDAARQYAAGRTVQLLEEEATRLAYWLEEHDTMAAMLSALVPDMRHQPVAFSCPAGQGSLLLRHAAVIAGLGSLGLNMMLLTPTFGPRIYLAGILTDLKFEPDNPFAGELCPGLEECGRCAVICPQEAIPLEARRDAALAEYRGLNAEACARSSQPFGPQRMVDQLRSVFKAESNEEVQRIVAGKDTMKLFHNLTYLRHAAFTGCMKCEMVCPIGEDYPEIEKYAVRRQDLPQGVKRKVSDGEVTIVR